MDNFKIKGFSFGYCAHKGELAGEKARHSLDLLFETGTRWIALCVEQRVETKRSLEIRADYNRNVTDLEVVEFIRYAHEKGMKVCLKPMINCRDGSWRAEIDFQDDLGAWAKWFYEYEGYLVHYAEIAEYTQCELFCLGCEMLGMESQEEHWRKLIADIRRIYSGPLTYNTNHGHEMDAGWYDALDYVGTSAYFRMHKADGSRPQNPMEPVMDLTREDMVASWKKVKERMQQVSEYWNRPVIFMEIGCRSARGTACQPWDFRMQFLPYDEREQALFYDSCMEVFENTDFFMGFFWWDWSAGVDESWAERKFPGFSIYGKQAEEVLRKYYTK